MRSTTISKRYRSKEGEAKAKKNKRRDDLRATLSATLKSSTSHRARTISVRMPTFNLPPMPGD